MVRISTLIAAPRDGALHSLRVPLLCQADIRVLAETHADVDPVRLVRTWRPDVLLLDAGMHGSSAISTLDRTRAISPTTRTLLFCVALSDSLVHRALKHGAKGCLRTGASVQQVVAAIKAVHAGEMWVTRKLAAEAFEKLLVLHVAPSLDVDGAQAQLSERELQIVEWMRRGMTNKEIARGLGISDTTVKTHAHNIFHKMNTSGRVRLLQKLQNARAPSTRANGKDPRGMPLRARSRPAAVGTSLLSAAASLGDSD
jgi:two-component system nitrate/nitrite response regulator NarL